MDLISQFHDHVSIKKMKESYSQIIPDAFTSNPFIIGRCKKMNLLNPLVNQYQQQY